MKTTLFPALAEVLALHERLLDRFGGSGAIGDLGLLESALMRPQSGYYGSLTEQASALLQSLCQNHAFVDGIKSVAFAVTAIFLRMNNYRLILAADEGEAFLIREVIVGKASLSVIATWIEAHLAKVN